MVNHRRTSLHPLLNYENCKNYHAFPMNQINCRYKINEERAQESQSKCANLSGNGRGTRRRNITFMCSAVATYVELLKKERGKLLLCTSATECVKLNKLSKIVKSFNQLILRECLVLVTFTDPLPSVALSLQNVVPEPLPSPTLPTLPSFPPVKIG